MILCVEDDSGIRDLMIYALNSAGFEARGLVSGAELFEALKEEKPRLILLDIMLPGEDGIRILKRLRADAATADIPVIMATAKGTEYDKVIGLDSGADDYLAKPFGMTAQLMAFKITDYIYPIIFAGFLLNFLSKKEQLKNLGTVIFSFGLLFEGIETMGSVMKPLAGSPIFTDLMGKVSETPVLGVLLGACMTLVVQSSSATIAVLQNFAAQAGADGIHSVIGLAGAIPILLGDNIGTTITALLASIGQSKDAKRTALAHSIFNISGSMVFVCIIPMFARFVTAISPKGPELAVISRQIANAHTTFNVVCTLAWLPLIPLMVKIVTSLVRGSDRMAAESGRPQYLDEKVIGQPVAAMYLVSNEISRCADLTSEMLAAARSELTGRTSDPAAFDGLYMAVKELQGAIVSYISRMFARGGLTEGQSERVAGLLSVINDVDRVADRFQEIVARTRGMIRDRKNFSDEAKKDLGECFSISEELFHRALQAAATGDRAVAAQTAQGRAARLCGRPRSASARRIWRV